MLNKELKNYSEEAMRALDSINADSKELKKSIEDFREASELQNSFLLDTYLKGEQYILETKTKWIDMLVNLMKTLITISVTIAIAAISLEQNSFISKSMLLNMSIVIMLISAIVIFVLICSRSLMINSYRAKFDWVIDKTSNTLNISYAKASMADLDLKKNRIDRELKKNVSRRNENK